VSQPDLQDRPRWTTASIALLVIGLLILLPSGLCTVLVAAEDSSGPDIVALILAVGAIPMGAGAALIYAALKIRPRGEQSAGSQPTPAGQGALRWTGVSIAFLVVGLLILVPSGLCTALIGGATLLEDADPSGFIAVLLYGAVPVALGAALVYAGFNMRRRD
jgi:hypothetical protein